MGRALSQPHAYKAVMWVEWDPHGVLALCQGNPGENNVTVKQAAIVAAGSFAYTIQQKQRSPTVAGGIVHRRSHALQQGLLVWTRAHLLTGASRVRRPVLGAVLYRAPLLLGLWSVCLLNASAFLQQQMPVAL